MSCDNNQLTIAMRRGDYKKLSFLRHSYSGIVIQSEPKDIFFTVKTSNLVEDFIFQKKLSDNTITFDNQTCLYTFEILPEDTNNLTYGDYKFDVEVLVSDNKKKTICYGTLKIRPEITWEVNEK